MNDWRIDIVFCMHVRGKTSLTRLVRLKVISRDKRYNIVEHNKNFHPLSTICETVFD